VSFFIGTGSATWDKSVVRNIIQRMMWPEDPLLPPTEQEQGRRRQEPLRLPALRSQGTLKPAADSYRVMSTSFDCTLLNASCFFLGYLLSITATSEQISGKMQDSSRLPMSPRRRSSPCVLSGLSESRQRTLSRPLLLIVSFAAKMPIALNTSCRPVR